MTTYSAPVEAKPLNISGKVVLGTAQFGMDYGIAKFSGKPTRKEIFGIFDLAWDKGIRRFDTAPGYGSETMLGEFIAANGLLNDAIVLTKIPSQEGVTYYEKSIKASLESSLENLGCPIEALFFHDPADSRLLLKDHHFFEKLLNIYPISTLGVSVYEPQEITSLSDCQIELAFQFPFNALDNRFTHVRMAKGKRYARSVFLQGLLASTKRIRSGAPMELRALQEWYHQNIANQQLDPIRYAVSAVVYSSAIDFFLVGVDSRRQLEEIMNREVYRRCEVIDLSILLKEADKKWLDPRTWN